MALGELIINARVGLTDEELVEQIKQKPYLLQLFIGVGAFQYSAPFDLSRPSPMTLAARPLKRAIQRELETPIAKGILGGQFIGGHTVAVDVESVGEQRQLRFQQMDPSKLPVLV